MISKLMSIFFIFTVVSLSEGAMEFKGMDLTKHHPGRVLAMLIGSCRKHEESCPMSIESTAQFLSNINELILNFDQKYEHRLLELIETLATELRQCKDAHCVMEFEEKKGRLFELVISKAGKILESVPEVEKFAWEQTILQPPPFFKNLNFEL